MIMHIGRLVFAYSIPVCLQCFLYRLMAHECDVEPTLCIKQVLSYFEVFVCNVKPVCNFVFSHICVL